MRRGRSGTGEQRDRDAREIGSNVTRVRWDRGTIGQGCKGNREQCDRGAIGLGNNGTGLRGK